MKLTIKEAKEKAFIAKQSLIAIKKKSKKDKELIKLLDEFLVCHCSNEAIFTKYAKLKAKMSELE